MNHYINIKVTKIRITNGTICTIFSFVLLLKRLHISPLRRTRIFFFSDMPVSLTEKHTSITFQVVVKILSITHMMCAQFDLTTHIAGHVCG